MNADVPVRELMDREYVGVSQSDDLLETVELLLVEESEEAIVQRGSEHVGVLTQRDVLSLLVEGPPPEDATVGDAMTESVPTITPDRTLDHAADEMSTRATRRLVVTNGSEPLGVITERDLLDSRAYHRASNEDEVTDAVTEQRATAAMETTGETASVTDVESSREYSDQSICEGCGRLSSDLASFNGQLLCPNCRDM